MIGTTNNGADTPTAQTISASSQNHISGTTTPEAKLQLHHVAALSLISQMVNIPNALESFGKTVFKVTSTIDNTISDAKRWNNVTNFSGTNNNATNKHNAHTV